MRSTLVSRDLRVSLKQRPISFLDTLLTAQISIQIYSIHTKCLTYYSNKCIPQTEAFLPLNVLGTPSCLQAIQRQAEAIASLLRPFKLFCSCTCLKSVFARS